MRAVDKMISSKTGTLPPTMPVLPPCVFTARFLSWQYLGRAQGGVRPLPTPHRRAHLRGPGGRGVQEWVPAGEAAGPHAPGHPAHEAAGSRQGL